MGAQMLAASLNALILSHICSSWPSVEVRLAEEAKRMQLKDLTAQR